MHRQVLKMKTRGSREKRKVWDKIYLDKDCKSAEKKKAKRKYDQERRKRKRIEESLLNDAQVGGEKICDHLR